jgi:hypothetical protein
MNAKSGGGNVERFQLVEEARRRGVEPIVLAPGDDLRQLAEQAVARGADVIGMAGGDGSQAAVAAVATAHDVGFVCVPAGTRNHLAMDLGLDRDDVVGAFDAFEAAVERGLHAAPFDLRFTGPDGTEQPAAHLIMVANNRYELGHPGGFGSRRRIDAGTLASSRRGSSPPPTPRGSTGCVPPGRPDRAAGSNGPTPPSRYGQPNQRCWTRRSGSRSSPQRCACASHHTRPATRPLPPCQPRAGPPSPRCGRRPPADR